MERSRLLISLALMIALTSTGCLAKKSSSASTSEAPVSADPADDGDEASGDVIGRIFVVKNDKDTNFCNDISDEPVEDRTIQGTVVQSYEFLYAFKANGVAIGARAYSSATNCTGASKLFAPLSNDFDMSDMVESEDLGLVIPLEITEFTVANQPENIAMIKLHGDFNSNDEDTSLVTALFVGFINEDETISFTMGAFASQDDWSDFSSDEAIIALLANPTCDGVDPENCDFSQFKPE